MTDERADQAPRSESSTDEQLWAELADLVLIIAREIQFRGYTDERAISLSQSEGAVMRHLQQDAEATPSRIAAATGLQRTNLSTVMRGLEERGLIERRDCPNDRRGVTVSPTELGRANTVLVRRLWAETISNAVAGDSTGRDAALTVLTAVKEGLARRRG